MAKIKVNNYVFDKTAQTVTFSDFGGSSLRLDSILIVANVTSNIFIFNPVVTGLGGTVSSNVLTFEYDSSTMQNTDDLLIYYDDAASALVSVTNNDQLPTNAATETKQDTGNSSLATIAGKDFATQTTLAAILAKILSAPATEAKQDTIITDLGTVTETAPGTDTASSGLNGRLQRIAQRLTSLIALVPGSLGQKVMASSFAVTIASDQSDLPVSIASIALPTGASTSAKQDLILAELQLKADLTETQPVSLASLPALASGSAIVGKFGIDQTTPGTTNAVAVASSALPTGASTETTSASILAKIIAAPATEAKQDSIITAVGSLTETAPGTDTASSGLNGRLQRVAQLLTGLGTKLPTALGQGTMATSMKVVLPSDQSSIPVAATLTAETTKVIGTVNNSSNGHSATVTITRPSNATAYAAGDVIGDTNGSAILTFASMARAAGEVEITSIEYEIDESARPSGMDMFDVRLYNASPTAIADNAVFDIPSGDRGKYLGKVRIGVPIDEGSTLFIDNDCIGKQITLSSTSLYVILQTVGGYTPTSAGVSRLTIHTRDL